MLREIVKLKILGQYLRNHKMMCGLQYRMRRIQSITHHNTFIFDGENRVFLILMWTVKTMCDNIEPLFVNAIKA